LLLVDGLRSSFTTSGTVELFLLLGAGDVAIGSSIVIREISPMRLHSTERTLPRSGKNRVHPLRPTSEELRSRSESMRLWEERIDLVDTMSERVAFDSRFQRTDLGGISDDR